ncbi:MAG TPA: DUF2917 domain-containing protein [Rhodocyclaceae bacterium]|nr:DUF2917 domain-containing protein [Rhodocyclaceae bacterium]
MSDNRQVRRFTIGPRVLRVIDDARGQLLSCECGELWITLDGDHRDIILSAGSAWRVDRTGPVVLSAFRPARATLAHLLPGRAASLPRRDGAAALLDRILRWRFPALASFPATRIL